MPVPPPTSVIGAALVRSKLLSAKVTAPSALIAPALVMVTPDDPNPPPMTAERDVIAPDVVTLSSVVVPSSMLLIASVISVKSAVAVTRMTKVSSSHACAPVPSTPRPAAA